MRRHSWLPLAATLLVVPARLKAQTETMTFSEWDRTWATPAPICYTVGSYHVGLGLASPCQTSALLWSWPNQNGYGPTAGGAFAGVYNPGPLPVRFWRSDFGAFRLVSIDVFPLYGPSTPIVTHVALSVWDAFTEDTYWYAVDPARDVPTRITLGSAFSGVTNVVLRSYDSPSTGGGVYAVQFSNVAFSPVTTAPEPATLGMLASGLVAFTLVANRRRASKSR
jgi:hypothetical protein